MPAGPSIPAVRCHNWDELRFAGPGAFKFTFDKAAMILILPGSPNNEVSSIRIGSKGDKHPYWELSGTDDKPTLSPSLMTNHWHGWLRDGVFIPC